MVDQPPGQVRRNGSGIVAQELDDDREMPIARYSVAQLPTRQALFIHPKLTRKLLPLQAKIEPSTPDMVP